MFLSKYHRMSMAETRHHMERAIFGVRLRYRKPASRRNEVLAREICHNVRLLAKGDGSSVYVQGPEINRFVEFYYGRRLYSAIAYRTPGETYQKLKQEQEGISSIEILS